MYFHLEYNKIIEHSTQLIQMYENIYKKQDICVHPTCNTIIEKLTNLISIYEKICKMYIYFKHNVISS